MDDATVPVSRRQQRPPRIVSSADHLFCCPPGQTCAVGTRSTATNSSWEHCQACTVCWMRSQILKTQIVSAAARNAQFKQHKPSATQKSHLPRRIEKCAFCRIFGSAPTSAVTLRTNVTMNSSFIKTASKWHLETLQLGTSRLGNISTSKAGVFSLRGNYFPKDLT